MQRDKVSLDLIWLRDESLEDSENLPPPEVIAQEIVEVMRPEPGMTICDPACGTGGFLLAARGTDPPRRRRRSTLFQGENRSRG